MLKKLKNRFRQLKLYILFIAVFIFTASIFIQKNHDKKFLPNHVIDQLQFYINDFQIEVNKVSHSLSKYQPNNQLKISDTLLDKNFEWIFIKDSSSKPIAWNSHFNFSIDFINKNGVVYYDKGVFYIKKDSLLINHEKYLIYGILFLKNNDYFNPNFTELESINEFYGITHKKTVNKPVVNELNKPIFYLAKIQNGFFIGYCNWVIFLRILSILTLILWLNFLVRIYSIKNGFVKGYFLLIACAITLRVITYLFKFPFWFQKLPLFHPEIYASNFLHPSLGDLLINTFLFFWLVSILSTQRHSSKFSLTSKRYYIHILPILAFVAITFFLINIIISLILDSKIPFEVSNFFSLNIYTVIALIVICLMTINYIRLSILLVHFISKIKFKLYHYLFINAFAGCFFVFIFDYANKYGIVFSILVLFWNLLFSTLLFYRDKKIILSNSSTEIQNLFFVILFTTLITSLTIFFEKKLDIAQRKIFAEKTYLELTNAQHFSLTHKKDHKQPYAIYTNGKLISQDGNYYFNKNINEPKQSFEIDENLYSSIVYYKADKNITIAVLRLDNVILNFITLFAYLSVCFLLVNSLILFLVKFGNFKQPKFSLHLKSNISIRNQIRTTFIILFICIFLTIAFTSLYFYINKFNKNYEEKVMNTFNTIEQIVSDKNIDDSSVINSIVKIENRFNLQINLYDFNGHLINKNKFLQDNEQNIASTINYKAFENLYINKDIFYRTKIQNFDENIDAYYKIINNEKGNIKTCVCINDIAYFDELKTDLSGFIATLININAFVFLLTVALGLFITNRITSSFSLIKNKMKEINWSSSNSEIEWKRNDEIGALVAEYNILVKKLEANAKDFAASQKEVAWKEMAKQVAHEIKNPLTPMKLSIQYLQNKIDDDAPNIKQLSKTVAKTLIEQIDQLTFMANDFFQFANIDNIHPQKIDINEIISSIIDLHKTNENIVFDQKLFEEPKIIDADKSQILRLFTNIIKNAIEATEKRVERKIGIYQTSSNGNIITAIQDNGTGISKELQDKIFSLNFTTKISGTGLGLTICKAIVDNAQGKIWFNSNENGTTFFIELKLV